MPIIASTLTTVAVFLPVVFLEGIAAQLFLDQALTVSFSLLASLVVSLTLIPMLAALTGGAYERAAVGPAAEAGRIRRGFRFVFVTIPALIVGAIRFVIRWTLRLLGAVEESPIEAYLNASKGG